MGKISAVYQIINTVTGDRYVGSSRNVKQRWACHKCQSTWNEQPNKPLYQDFQKYGLENFRFQILAPVMPECLTQVEQEFIDMLKPTYNKQNAKGTNVEMQKETKMKCQKKYRQTEKGKEMNRKQARKDMKKYNHQLCLYNGEEVLLVTLAGRFFRAGIKHPTLEAKKYLLNK